MSKIEKDIKKSLINEFSDSKPSENLRKRVFNNLGFNNNFEQNYEKKHKSFGSWSFKKISLISSFACLLLIAIIGAILILSPKPTEKPKYQAIVQIDVNPSIEMTVDENNNVTSIRGLNDEGKMLVLDEELENKKIDEVLNMLIDLELKTGYLDVNSSENKMKVAVSSETEEINEELTNIINNSLTEIKTNKNLDMSINFNVGASIESIKLFVKSVYPYINIDELSYNELVNKISLYNKEVSNLTSTRLEELYIEFKNDYFEAQIEQYIDNLVNELDQTYILLVDKYNELYNSFLEAYKNVEDAFIQYFLDDESLYQQALSAVNNKKIDYLKQKKVVDQAKNDSLFTYQYELGKLLVIKNEYKFLKEALETQEELAKSTYQKVVDILDGILVELKDIKNQLPSSIKEVNYDNVFDSVEKVNESIITLFTDKYSSYIGKMRDNAKKTKELLKNE